MKRNYVVLVNVLP